ncbi:MAG: hypothetical protein ACFB14_21495 [Leptolyngbyaceae cyanobacterium]
MNENRRVEYRQQVEAAKPDDGVELVWLEAAESSLPYANLYIWREKRKDAPVPAISAFRE